MTTRKATTSLRPEVLEEIEEAERRRARFCIATGVSPAEYDEMTLGQIALWIDVVNERNKN